MNECRCMRGVIKEVKCDKNLFKHKVQSVRKERNLWQVFFKCMQYLL